MESNQQSEKVTDIDASQIGDEPTAEAASVKKDEREYTLPDGSYFRGTPEEFREAMQDYRDRIGAA
ncbi:hypothetical protein IJV57_01325 [Candidatus Saccharibacteria bacterium]|nr:hypothetical protein [Candidatus Saccharibacteria bacterium]